MCTMFTNVLSIYLIAGTKHQYTIAALRSSGTEKNLTLAKQLEMLWFEQQSLATTVEVQFFHSCSSIIVVVVLRYRGGLANAYT